MPVIGSQPWIEQVRFFHDATESRAPGCPGMHRRRQEAPGFVNGVVAFHFGRDVAAIASDGMDQPAAAMARAPGAFMIQTVGRGLPRFDAHVARGASVARGLARDMIGR
ncbi:MAG TPA: hypothetical protein VIP05_01800 [Burkholderiaceae bacterium]